jgi:hypothetical protein
MQFEFTWTRKAKIDTLVNVARALMVRKEECSVCEGGGERERW